MPLYIVLLGAPGAGKGTQAVAISEKLNLPHVSSGDLFRENIKNQTDLGKKVKAILDRGDLVPDDITIAMIRDRLARPDCSGGAVLDGFPRTPPQAKALDKLLAEFNGRVDAAPYIKVEEQELVERLSGRRTCRSQGHIFHLKYNPPATPGVCDFDGSELYQRGDDKPETVKERIRVYLENTTPLIDYYRRKAVLLEIDGAQAIEQVTAELLADLALIEE